MYHALWPGNLVMAWVSIGWITVDVVYELWSHSDIFESSLIGVCTNTSLLHWILLVLFILYSLASWKVSRDVEALFVFSNWSIILIGICNTLLESRVRWSWIWYQIMMKWRMPLWKRCCLYYPNLICLRRWIIFTCTCFWSSSNG